MLFNEVYHMSKGVLLPVADPGGTPDALPPPPRTKIFLILRSFLQNFVGVVTLCAQDISANLSCDDIHECVNKMFEWH